MYIESEYFTRIKIKEERLKVFMILKKKQMVVTALVLMLGIAGYLNYRYDKDPLHYVSIDDSSLSEPDIGETAMVSGTPKEPVESAPEDYFSERRLERDSARSKTYEQLKKTLDDPDISDEMRKRTEESMTRLMEYEQAEVTAQNQLASKGFDTTFVYITDDNVTVYVKRNGISRSDTAKIVDIIYELTQNNNIKIVEVD